jgi:DNA-binding IclR family transcriptional regulator
MKTNRSVERGLSVLLYVCDSERPLGLTEISRGTGLDKATTHRLINTLVNADMIRVEEGTRRYLHGPGIYNFWPGEIRKLCRPHLQVLLNKVQETICLIVPRGKMRVCLDAIEPDRELRIVAPIGRQLPIYLGASGRVFMAFRPVEQAEAILDDPEWIPPAFENQPDKESYLNQLAAVRASGFAHNTGEVAADTSTIAAPVFDGLGNNAAAVVIRGPTTRMKEKVIGELASLVTATAQEISGEFANMNS